MAKKPNRFPLKKAETKKPKAKARKTTTADADVEASRDRDIRQLVYIRKLEAEVEDAEDLFDKAKRHAKNAKSHYEAKVDQLRAAVRERDENYPLFSGDATKSADTKKADPAAVPDGDTGTVPTATEGVEIDWRTKLVSVLGLGKRLTEKLTEARINTMGELRDRANLGDLPAELKMTDAEREKFGKACEDFYAEHKIGDAADNSAGTDVTE